MVTTELPDGQDERVAGYRLLALAVLRLAVRDAVSGPAAAQREARAFFAKRNDDLVHWCRLAGVNDAALVRRFRETRAA